MNESDKRLKKIDPALRKQGHPQGQLTKKAPLSKYPDIR